MSPPSGYSVWNTWSNLVLIKKRGIFFPSFSFDLKSPPLKRQAANLRTDRTDNRTQVSLLINTRMTALLLFYDRKPVFSLSFVIDNRRVMKGNSFRNETHTERSDRPRVECSVCTRKEEETGGETPCLVLKIRVWSWMRMSVKENRTEASQEEEKVE